MERGRAARPEGLKCPRAPAAVPVARLVRRCCGAGHEPRWPSSWPGSGTCRTSTSPCRTFVRLASAEPRESTAFIDLRVDRGGASGTRPEDPAALGAVQPDLAQPHARGAHRRGQRLLAARGHRLRRAEGVDGIQPRADGVRARGVSTITQQLAKNLYLSPSKNPVRKLRELMIARRLEAVLSKRRILELYLNVVEWGDGIFGAEAAARAHFGGPASGLGPEQAALLAGALINARALDPSHPTGRLLRRQRMLLRRMGRVTPPPDTGEAGRRGRTAGSRACRRDAAGATRTTRAPHRHRTQHRQREPGPTRARRRRRHRRPAGTWRGRWRMTVGLEHGRAAANVRRGRRARMLNYTDAITALMRDIVERGRPLSLHRPVAGARVRALRTRGADGPVRDVPLAQPAHQRARLLLLA